MRLGVIMGGSLVSELRLRVALGSSKQRDTLCRTNTSTKSALCEYIYIYIYSWSVPTHISFKYVFQCNFVLNLVYKKRNIFS